MDGRILHVLSQRPGLTGSGITLDAMVRQAALAGWRQAAVVGVPAGPDRILVGDLPPANIHPVFFAPEQGAHPADLPFPVPGMSDVMPYPSSVWSKLAADQLALYRSVWRAHLAAVIARFQPDLIHSHHIWLVSSLLKEIAPERPVVTTCHATGLRQMELTPALAAEVRQGCARIDHFCVLRDDHGTDLQRSLGLDADRITVVGAGYRPDLFSIAPEVRPTPTDLLYVGKYSHAKGLPWLMAAFDRLRRERPDLRLHIAGGGSGPEADQLRRRMTEQAPAVILHGQLDQAALARLMRQCGVCVLPSFYEGVPLVLVEAAACGAQLVASALPGVVERIAPHLGDRMQLVPLPRLVDVDRPVADDLPRFVDNLCDALALACRQAATAPPPAATALAPFTWQAVFGRVQKVWHGQIS